MKVHWILSIPPPLFNIDYVRLSDRFCGRNNIEMGGGGGGGGKKNENAKNIPQLQCLNSFCTGLQTLKCSVTV